MSNEADKLQKFQEYLQDLDNFWLEKYRKDLLLQISNAEEKVRIKRQMRDKIYSEIDRRRKAEESNSNGH